MSERKQKIGANHVSDMGKRGLGEIAQALPAFPANSIQPVEVGMAGNAAHLEPARDEGAYESLLSRYDSRTQPEHQKSKDLER